MPAHFKAVDLDHASRLINHGPTVLVTTAHGTRRNLMAAAWSMPVEFTPPRIAIVIDKRTFTAELAAASGRIGVCIPGAGIADLVYAVGNESGRDHDKFERHRIDARPGPVLGMPWLEHGCLACMEGRLIREPHAEAAYDTWFAEIVAATADERVFTQGRWVLDDTQPDLRTIHHLGGGHFAPAGPVIRARPPAGR